MSHAHLQATVEKAWDDRETITTTTGGAVREAVETALDLLDGGKARVAERASDGAWMVNQWLKKAVLLSFRLNDMAPIPGGPATPHGGTRSPPSSTAGARASGAPRASAPYPTARCAVRPLSRPASSSCRVSSISAPMWIPAPWSTLGRRWARAPRSARTCICPAASASAACWSRCRRALPSSRTTASSAPVRKWWKA